MAASRRQKSKRSRTGSGMNLDRFEHFYKVKGDGVAVLRISRLRQDKEFLQAIKGMRDICLAEDE